MPRKAPNRNQAQIEQNRLDRNLKRNITSFLNRNKHIFDTYLEVTPKRNNKLYYVDGPFEGLQVLDKNSKADLLEKYKRYREAYNNRLIRERKELFNSLEEKPYQKLNNRANYRTITNLEKENTTLRNLLEQQTKRKEEERKRRQFKLYRFEITTYGVFTEAITFITKRQFFRADNDVLVSITKEEAKRLREQGIPIYYKNHGFVMNDRIRAHNSVKNLINDYIKMYDDENVDEFSPNMKAFLDKLDYHNIKDYEEIFQTYIKPIFGSSTDIEYIEITKIHDYVEPENNVPDNYLSQNANYDSSISGFKMVVSEYIQNNYKYRPDMTLDDIFTQVPMTEYLQNKDNFREHECVHQALIENYKAEWDKFYKNPLTVEVLDDIFQTSPEDRGVSPDDVIEKFCKPRNLRCFIMDIDGNLINYNIPEKEGRLRRSMYLITSNKHIYLCNSNIDKLKQICSKKAKLNKDEDENVDTYTPSYTLGKKSNIKSLYINDFFTEFSKINFDCYCDEFMQLIGKLQLDVNNLPSLNQIFTLCKKQDIDITKKELEAMSQRLKIKYHINTSSELQNIVEYLISKSVIPNIKVNKYNGLYQRVNIRINGFDISIQNVRDGLVGNLEFDNQHQFNTYEEYNNLLSQAMGRFDNVKDKSYSKSYYSDNFLKVSKLAMPTAIIGKVPNVDMKANIKIDFVKCYATALNGLKNLAVVSKFDKWMLYDNSGLEENKFYFISRHTSPSSVSLRYCLLKNKYTIFHGRELVQLWDDIQDYVEVVASCTISNTLDHELKELLESVYNDEVLSLHQKKALINILTGKIELTKFSNQSSKIFFDKTEASWFFKQYMKNNKESNPDILEVKRCSPEFVDIQYNEDGKMINAVMDNSALFYILTQNSETPLDQGYLPIKMQVYSAVRARLYQESKRIEQDGGCIVGYHTDAIYSYFDNKPEQIYNNEQKNIYQTLGNITLTHIDNNRIIGKLQDVHEKESLDYTMFYRLNEIEYVTLQHELTYENKNSLSHQEKQTNEIVEIIKQAISDKKHLLVSANMPGSGKTRSITEALLALKLHTINLTFTNKGKRRLIQDNGLSQENTYTFDKALGRRQKNDEANRYDKFIGKQILFIDEVAMLSISKLAVLFDIIEKFPEMIIIATGDIYQSKFNDNSSLLAKEEREYYNMILKQLFSHGIMFNNCKRMNVEDTKQLMLIKETLFSKENITIDDMKNLNIKVETDIKKLFDIHFDGEKEVFKGKILAYYVETCDIVNDLCHNYFRERIDSNGGWVEINNKFYRPGQLLIYRDNQALFSIDKENRFYCNYEYKISSINKANKIVTLYLNDEYDDKDDIIYLTIPWCKLSNFIYEYCGTLKASTGDTYHDCNVSILDFNSIKRGKFGISKEDLYMGLSRATSLSLNTLFDVPIGTFEYEDKFQRMVRSCINQDIKAKRPINKDIPYIDADWISSNLFGKQQCSLCGCDLGIIGSHKASNFSVDRHDCSLPHYKSNCRITCYICNLAKKH